MCCIRCGSRGGAKGLNERVQLHPPSFFCSLLFILFIVTPNYFNLQAGVKIVIITHALMQTNS